MRASRLVLVMGALIVILALVASVEVIRASAAKRHATDFPHLRELLARAQSDRDGFHRQLDAARTSLTATLAWGHAAEHLAAGLATQNGHLRHVNVSLSDRVEELVRESNQDFTVVSWLYGWMPNPDKAAARWVDLMHSLQGRGITALCVDGWPSYALRTQGQCSHHGGIAVDLHVLGD